eukprot:jgi/Botrbrau1/21308/Bobra.0184s0019.1
MHQAQLGIFTGHQSWQLGLLIRPSGLVPGTKDWRRRMWKGRQNRSMKNLGAVLEAAGSFLLQSCENHGLLQDMADFAKVNAIYGRFFPRSASGAGMLRCQVVAFGSPRGDRGCCNR